MSTPDTAKPPIVVLSGIRWDFLWQRHQIFATLFAQHGYPTVYVETTGLRNPSFDFGTSTKVLRRVLRSGGRGRGATGAASPPNLVVYSPLVAPPTWGVFRRLNRAVFVPRVARHVRRILGGVSPLVIAYPPTSTTLDLLPALEPRRVLYDCVLNYEHFHGIPCDVAETENALLRRADAVTVDSGFLLEKHRCVRPDMVQVGPGVDHELFGEARSGPLRRPARTVCFFGAMNEDRFDFDLVGKLAQDGYRVRLLGTLARPAFARLPNVEYRGEVPHRELPRQLADADALIIPYRITTFSKGTFPAKIFECLATGKPTIATPLPDLVPFGDLLYLAEDAGGFASALKRLPETETEQKVRVRVELARQNSWEARFRVIEEALWKA